MANITAITAPCTCTVDGVSGNALVREHGYTFAGCGAHTRYRNCEEQGYSEPLCYVTSPEDCRDKTHFTPEDLKRDDMGSYIRVDGAASKKCYDGYRCEAWWGDLEGITTGTPAVLGAPLDWPDCCALCSDMTESMSCKGWRFIPSTGTCQLLSTIGHPNKSAVWAMNASISGFPGFFEAPTTGCRRPEGYSFFTLYFMVWGCVLTFSASTFFIAILRSQCVIMWFWKRKFFEAGASLVKAACLEIRATTSLELTGSPSGPAYAPKYSGVFKTWNGTIIELPHQNPSSCRGGEQEMLRILFHTETRPLGEPNAPSPNERTPDALRRYFSHLRRRTLREQRQLVSERHLLNEESLVVNGDQIGSTPYDCLLLVGRNQEEDASLSRMIESPMEKVLLVGVLGEDRITCMDHRRSKYWIVMAFALPGAILVIYPLAARVIHFYSLHPTAPWSRPTTGCLKFGVVGLTFTMAYAVAPLVVFCMHWRTRRYLLGVLPPADLRRSKWL